MSILENFANELLLQQLDIRVTHNARFMDQKCTPDIISLIADCVLNATHGLQFTKNTIWHSEFFKENLNLYFGKPPSDEGTAANEYDKFTAQPLKTLAYAGILREFNRGRENYYEIANMEMLVFCSSSPTNAYKFLCVYLEAVYRQSGFYERYEEFRLSPHSRQDLEKLKSAFLDLIWENTPVKGVFEPKRIFPKAFNPLAVRDRIPGVRSGYVTEENYLYSELLYNSVNFRDTKKLKGLTRAQAGAFTPSPEYSMQKEMRSIRERHGLVSEVRDELAVGSATQVHHIFPKSTHPEYRDLRENLILLTPSQHYTRAHPANNTKLVDPAYQIVCLRAKLASLIESLKKNDGFYDFGAFLDLCGSTLGMTIEKSESPEQLLLKLNEI